MKTPPKKQLAPFAVTAAMRASVERAKAKVEADADGRSAMFREIEAAGNDLAKRDCAGMFGAFRVLGTGWMDDPKYQAEVRLVQALTARAIAERDGNFLIRLGKALKSEPQQPSLDKLDQWMISAWLPQDKDRIGLCHCVDGVITLIMEEATGRQGGLTQDTIQKRRQRLRLVKHPKPYVTAVKRGAGKLEFSPL